MTGLWNARRRESLMRPSPVSVLGLAAILCGLLGPFRPASAEAQERLVVYPQPQAATYTHHNDDFTVRVRERGGEWRDLYEYNVKVDHDGQADTQDASMVHFDMGAPVEIQIRKNNGDVRGVRVRPAALRIRPRLTGNTATFTLDRPRNLSIEFDGDRLHNLHLFASPLETERPNPNDPGVIYFGPGVHTPPVQPGGVFEIPSGATVYIAGGAILRGKLLVSRAENVRILGRGIIHQPDEGLQVAFSRNVLIDGPIVANSRHYSIFCGQSNGLTIRNFRAISAGKWTDGIDLMSCSNIEIDNVFLRTSDDSIAIYGHRWNYYGGASNYRITNSTLWADIAHPINIGLHGDTSGQGDVIENILFRNIDILEHDEDDPDYQGAMAISNGDLNLVRDVTFEDIRVEDFQEGQLLNLRVVFNTKYNAGPGRGIENVTFRNVSYNGPNDHPSIIAGLDAEHAVRGVRFEGLRINGRLIANAEDGNIRVGPHASDITFGR